MLVLGLMSGTSMDGIDAVLAEFEEGRFAGLRATHGAAYPEPLRRRLLELARSDDSSLSLRELASLDTAVADQFAAAALDLLARAGIEPAAIAAIGSHGQTIFHDTAGEPWATLQIGDPNRIAARSGIATVGDFRRKDMALGGQGAPLVPAFHHALFASADEPRCVVNIGGIANLTLLPGPDPLLVRGFDSGPGNGLMNEWSERHLGRPYDANGTFAASGRSDEGLLQALLSDPYFAQPPPKSTGRSYFQLAWAERRFPRLDTLAPADVQATLAELTARSIAAGVLAHAPATRRVLVCGGGAHNRHLMDRLRAALPGLAVQASDEHGLDADWVEAAAFAWLAMRTVAGLPGNLPAVTGAARATVLGGIYRP
ncbi:MAG: anhydro-N-acetylmuramic acid kinase [Nevskia sp.]|nr:anhydro-N-acetylmuramic acid kinase [Nevskia sp.]